VNFKKLQKVIIANSWLVIFGVLLVAIALDIYNTGYLKELFPVGEARIPLTIFVLIMGLWILIQGIKNIVNKCMEETEV